MLIIISITRFHKSDWLSTVLISALIGQYGIARNFVLFEFVNKVQEIFRTSMQLAGLVEAGQVT